MTNFDASGTVKKQYSSLHQMNTEIVDASTVAHCKSQQEGNCPVPVKKQCTPHQMNTEIVDASTVAHCKSQQEGNCPVALLPKGQTPSWDDFVGNISIHQTHNNWKLLRHTIEAVCRHSPDAAGKTYAASGEPSKLLVKNTQTPAQTGLPTGLSLLYWHTTTVWRRWNFDAAWRKYSEW